MTRRMTVTVDPAAVSMVRAIRTAAQGAPLLVITGRAFGDLASELGGAEAAVGELLSIAESVNRPVAVNMPTGADASSTVFISPRGWTEERLRGWIGGRHAELEGAFGRVTRLGSNRAEGCRRPRGAG